MRKNKSKGLTDGRAGTLIFGLSGPVKKTATGWCKKHVPSYQMPKWWWLVNDDGDEDSNNDDDADDDDDDDDDEEEEDKRTRGPQGFS